MEGQEKTAKTLKHLRLPEIMSEAESSEIEELDKLSKLEMKIEAIDEKWSKMDEKLGIILNKLNETLTWNINVADLQKKWMTLSHMNSLFFFPITKSQWAETFH